ncbi:MAG: mannose-1-phosphate guanylyltransferase, partial [Opitutaceae bacterium]
MPAVYACILAGGTGERFWPMSRERTPKQLLKLLSPRPMIADAIRRLEPVVPPSRILVLTGRAQLDGVRAALPSVPPEQIIAEPARRDTGPAAALATALVRARDPRGIVALFPADAYIRDAGGFARQLAGAVELLAAAEEAMLLTFGIVPDHPATGFGYLQIGEEIARAGGVVARRVARFVEKPDEATARGYVAAGGYAWNAGMFLWRADAFLAEAARQAPALAAFIRDFPEGDPAAYIEERFPRLPRISVDYAIMEKAASVGVVLAEFDWDDVGAWSALPRHLPADEAGNTVSGPAALVDAANNIVVSNGRVIALCGVRDLVVVET